VVPGSYQQKGKKTMKFVRKQKDGSATPLKAADKKSKVQLPPWKVLVVDDEIDIHTVTQLALKDFSFAGSDFADIPSLIGYSGTRDSDRMNHGIAVAL
jgi:hypothetical protein